MTLDPPVAREPHNAPGPSGTGAGLVGWYERHRGGRAVGLAWVLSRGLMLVVLVLLERFMVGDVFYYWRRLAAIGEVGLSGTLVEYPTPVVWILSLPYGLALGTRSGYLVAFMALMLALDAAFTLALWRSSGRRHGTPIDFWLLFVVGVGPLAYLRFDLLPAVLAGGALLAARRRPGLTGALTGLGAAIKLWPALLIGPFLAHRPGRRSAGLAFLGVGVGLALVSLIAGGWTRLVSPLTWQSDRGLQIESVWATPLMVARALRPDRWVVDKSQYQAYEIFGPGVSGWLVVSTVATAAGLAMIALLSVRALRAPSPTVSAVGLTVLAVVAVMTVTNKTLSPQYLLWLGGPMAALLLLASGESDRTLARRLAGQLLGLAVLTQLVYPIFYDGLLGRWGPAMVDIATAVTAVRNLALVAFTVELAWLAWRALGPATTRSTARSSRTGHRG